MTPANHVLSWVASKDVSHVAITNGFLVAVDQHGRATGEYYQLTKAQAPSRQEYHSLPECVQRAFDEVLFYHPYVSVLLYDEIQLCFLTENMRAADLHDDVRAAELEPVHDELNGVCAFSIKPPNPHRPDLVNARVQEAHQRMTDEGLEFGCHVAAYLFQLLMDGEGHDMGDVWEHTDAEEESVVMFHLMDVEREELGIKWSRAYLCRSGNTLTAQSFFE